MFNHIAYNHEILNGKPYIAGTRLSIEFILELFASGGTKEEILKTYPQLSAEAIEEVFRFSATVDYVLNKNAELYKRLS
ncbi:MAG: DUF433 domain-containing protein [Anaerolineales bacterium]|nr:DUF433 domain-containing protein [Anaerolineales bacterium]